MAFDRDKSKQSFWLAVVLTLSSAIPLLWPTIPPLIDLPAHMGRYTIELDLDRSPFLHQWFSFRWALIANLGVDLLIKPLGAMLGVELATKLIVIGIVLITVAGFFWVAWEIHGNLPPTTAFAVPLVYNYAFQFGFVNYCLSMGLALLSFALWLRLGRQARWKLRAGLFLGIAPLLWITHIFGWGVLGLLCFSSQMVIAYRQAGVQGVRGYWTALRQATLACLPLAWPLLLMILWRSQSTGQTRGWLDFLAKIAWSLALFGDRWVDFDLYSAVLLYLLLISGLVFRRWLCFNPVLGAGALLLELAFLSMPFTIFGSDFASVRLVPFIAAIGLLALRPGPMLTLQKQRLLAIIGIAFAVVRLIFTTVSYILYAQSYDRELVALNYIPEGSRIIAFVRYPCYPEWDVTHLKHLPNIAIVRKQAFVNDQFQEQGAQLLRVTYAAAGKFGYVSSASATAERCPWSGAPMLSESLATFPRSAFDFVWLLDIPRSAWPHDPMLQPVWSNGNSALYHIRRR